MSDDTTPSTSGRPERASLVISPVTGGVHGFPQTSSAIDLEPAGYVEEEYLFSGTADSYAPVGEFGSDGHWSVAIDRSADFVTRMLVRRPVDASAFSGTVVVEWLNVTSLTDVDPDFGYLADELLRNGDVWVGVSAQAAGIHSTGGSDFGPAAIGLKAWDADRYGALSHPGDDFSYDIFSQAGRVIGSDDGPLEGLEVECLIAAGESQSAHRMVTYVDALALRADVYDAYLIHSRFGNGAPLSDAHPTAVPEAVGIRTDLDAPVIQLLTETDLFAISSTPAATITPFPPARQPDSEWVRTWEIAGTAHADGDYLRLLSIQGQRQFEGFLDLSTISIVANNGPQKFVVRAALRALDRWVADGTPAPGFPFLAVDDASIVRDELGNAVGGVRTPQLDVPVAMLTGEGAGNVGRTVPFTIEQLVAAYGTVEEFRSRFGEALDRAVAAGVILKDDISEILRDAHAIDF